VEKAKIRVQRARLWLIPEGSGIQGFMETGVTEYWNDGVMAFKDLHKSKTGRTPSFNPILQYSLTPLLHKVITSLSIVPAEPTVSDLAYRTRVSTSN
jgi:hypothetical protein